MMKKLLAAAVVVALVAGPAVAQEEGAGELASQIAPGNPLQVPPGIYAYSAAKLADFFAATNGARTIFAKDLKAKIESGAHQLLVDTRIPQDFASGHVPGAVNIPLAVLFRPENLAKLPTDGTPIVLICHTGHTASMALGGLVALGYNPFVLRFAMMGWKSQTEQKIWTSSLTQTIYGLPDAPLEY
jgi:rhodanese-related sulfurtransferase